MAMRYILFFLIASLLMAFYWLFLQKDQRPSIPTPVVQRDAEIHKPVKAGPDMPSSQNEQKGQKGPLPPFLLQRSESGLPPGIVHEGPPPSHAQISEEKAERLKERLGIFIRQKVGGQNQ
ncbi:MAG: hypothetical protein PHC35_02285 [Deltaproteobacteria bacterium]|jgi:hypothetical protein|nr:hypothetical protein [Deltaproteobacteria bacterium]